MNGREIDLSGTLKDMEVGGNVEPPLLVCFRVSRAPHKGGFGQTGKGKGQVSGS